MDQKVTYECQTYNALKAFLYAFPVFIVATGIILEIGIQLRNPLIGVIGWILICSIPFLFQKKFKLLFTRNDLLEFDTQSFNIKECSLNNDDLLKETSIDWKDIKSYKCYFSSSDTTYLVIYLRQGLSKSFSFKDGKTQEQALNEKSVFSLFNEFIRNYNSDKDLDNRITVVPGFFATKTGGVVLISVIILGIVGVIIHLTLQSSTSFATIFMSFFIIMGLIIKRFTDKKLYSKIIELDNRSSATNA